MKNNKKLILIMIISSLNLSLIGQSKEKYKCSFGDTIYVESPVIIYKKDKRSIVLTNLSDTNSIIGILDSYPLEKAYKRIKKLYKYKNHVQSHIVYSILLSNRNKEKDLMKYDFVNAKINSIEINDMEIYFMKPSYLIDFKLKKKSEYKLLNDSYINEHKGCLIGSTKFGVLIDYNPK